MAEPPAPEGRRGGRRWPRVIAILPLLATGCVAFSLPPQTAHDCIAYESGIAALVLASGCATQLNPHWAVMAKHEWRLTPAGEIDDPDFDLVFFPRDGEAPDWTAPQRGEAVVAYGNPETTAHGEAIPGRVLAVDTWQGDDDPQQFPAVYYSGPIRVGYSGGPLVNAKGAVVGMTVEVLVAEPRINRTGAWLQAGDGIALPADLIRREFARLVAKEPALAAWQPHAPIDDAAP